MRATQGISKYARLGKNNGAYKDGRTLRDYFCSCGKKITWQAKRCLSCSNSKNNKGRKFTLEHRNKLNAKKIKKLEIKCSQCNKIFLRCPSLIKEKNFCSLKCKITWFSGKNSPVWQGGKSFLPYPSLWKKQLKEKIRVRDNFICQKCGIPELELLQGLHIHHIDCDKNNCAEDNLISLCGKCHISVHNNLRKKNASYFIKN